MEEAVLSILRRMGEAYGEREDKVGADNTDQERAEKIWQAEQELSRCETEIMRIKGLRHGKYKEYKNGGISREQFIEAKKGLDGKEERLAAEKERLEKELWEVKIEEEGQEAGGRMIQKLLPFGSLTREMVETFIRRVVILGDGCVRIEWNFEDFCRFCEI